MFVYGMFDFGLSWFHFCLHASVWLFTLVVARSTASTTGQPFGPLQIKPDKCFDIPTSGGQRPWKMRDNGRRRKCDGLRDQKRMRCRGQNDPDIAMQCSMYR